MVVILRVIEFCQSVMIPVSYEINPYFEHKYRLKKNCIVLLGVYITQ